MLAKNDGPEEPIVRSSGTLFVCHFGFSHESEIWLGDVSSRPAALVARPASGRRRLIHARLHHVPSRPAALVAGPAGGRRRLIHARLHHVTSRPAALVARPAGGRRRLIHTRLHHVSSRPAALVARPACGRRRLVQVTDRNRLHRWSDKRYGRSSPCVDGSEQTAG